nr:MAG TPA: hypothetical protein [Caudoviricetes sp.]
MEETFTIIPEKESRSEKFIRIATPRVNAIITKLSNCAGANYSYTEDHVEAMFKAIRDAVDKCYSQFKPKAKTEKEKFEF